MLIEKQIHQIWVGSKKISNNLLNASKSWKRYNPDYSYRLHKTKDCVDLISKHYPQYLNIYESLYLPVQKADLVRYIIIYHYGGIYADLDTSAIKPLSKIIKASDQCLIGRDEDKKRDGKVLIEYLQWFFAARKNHPVFKEILNVIRERFQLKPCTLERISKNEYTYWLTGPQAFTEGVTRFLNKNNRLYTITIKGKCYFGSQFVYYNKKCLDKAILLHHYEGSWKQSHTKKDSKWYLPKNLLGTSSKAKGNIGVKKSTDHTIESFSEIRHVPRYTSGTSYYIYLIVILLIVVMFIVCKY